MSFEAKDYPISDILNKAVFDIPRNQRRYVWKKENCLKKSLILRLLSKHLIVTAITAPP